MQRTVRVQKGNRKPFDIPADHLTAFEHRGYRKVVGASAPPPVEAKKGKEKKEKEPPADVDSNE